MAFNFSCCPARVCALERARMSRGYVIRASVHRYVCGQKKIELYFSDRLTHGRTSRQYTDLLYHCFLQKCFLHRVKQGLSYIMCTLLYLSGWTTQLSAQTLGKYRHLVSLGSKSTYRRPDNKQNHCKLGKNVNMRL